MFYLGNVTIYIIEREKYMAEKNNNLTIEKIREKNRLRVKRFRDKTRKNKFSPRKKSS